MSTSQQTDPLIGRLVDGRYRVRARIARGGMATVYVATDLRLERRVALKVMHSHLSDDTVFQSRFIQEARAAARQAISAPIVAELFALWQQTLPRISGKSKLAEAIRYAIARRDIFERFLTDGLIELDSNIVERAIRPQTITRKNSLFAGSDGGGRTWATIATLLQTCKMNNVDPTAWLTQTLERIANQWPSAKIDVLMPWNYTP